MPSTRNGTAPPHSTDNMDTSTVSCSSMPAQQEAKAVLLQLLLGVHQELQLHDSYAAKWDVDAADEGMRPSPATAAYCSFLMEVAQDPQVGVGSESVQPVCSGSDHV